MKIQDMKNDDEKIEKRIKRRRRQIILTPGDVIFNILNYAFFALFTIVCFLPFYYIFINTVSNNELANAGLITLLPKGFHLDNYFALRRVDNFGQAVLVTVARTIIGTILMVIASAFCGYLVTKKEMWGRRFWYRFLIITMYFNAGLIPWYLNMSMLGLTNNFWGYIIPAIVAPYNIILVKTYIESIPAELEESASIDGAGYLLRFRKIIFPLCKPILATITIFGALGHWNSFIDAMILMGNKPQLQTLQYVLYVYLNKANNLAAAMKQGGILSDTMIADALSGRTIKFTVAMVSIIPILCVYPFLSRYFQKGIMIGAVKG
ncbi:MAG: carbohydrate transporter rane protein 2, family [Herbinix sp.]|jgi:multiple sugar transport system permease protein/putative aldouronate transport system permease protein|nr:carbohydrate transporter rane protein 2, family [Herbinix sp.]